MEEWIRVSPEIIEPGTNKLEISARPNTGRHERSTILKFNSIVNPDIVREVYVTQKGSEEYVTFCGIKEIVLESKETDIVVCGITNSSRLTFSLGEGNLDVELPDEYNAGGIMNANGHFIEYDPGQHDEFGFRIVLHIPENKLNENRQKNLIVEDNNGKKVSLLITQLTM